MGVPTGAFIVVQGRDEEIDAFPMKRGDSFDVATRIGHACHYAQRQARLEFEARRPHRQRRRRRSQSQTFRRTSLIRCKLPPLKLIRLIGIHSFGLM